MDDARKAYASDDEEDLEALRLAALRTIKKKNAALNGSSQAQHSLQRNSEKGNRFNRSMKPPQSKRGRFFGPHQGRNAKNGQFNVRSRNPNLISIPTTTDSEEPKLQEKESDNEVTINLPQNRYCGINTKEDKKEEETSKFNRYNKSDESESESEEEEGPSEDDSPGKLHKADSLEALMQELEDEIQGKTKTKENLPSKNEKVKVKKVKKKKLGNSEIVSTSDSDVKPNEVTAEKSELDTKTEVIKHTEADKVNSESEVKDEKSQDKPTTTEELENVPRFDENQSPVRKRPRSRSPMNRRFPNRRRQRNFHKFQNPPLQNIPFAPPLSPYAPPVLPYSNLPFNPMFAPPAVGMINQPPPFYERPLSPLAINTESLTTATLAPLSPRSAAFVLQNKAIVERRKRSPRRTYSSSRSPSRSPRRSLTPRRSPRRSVSPRRISRSPRRLSRSPRRRSLSPRRRSLSPRRRNVGKSTDTSPKNRAPVRARLGLKTSSEESKEKTKDVQTSPKKDEKPLDPVLEARKKKFESNEIKMKEGIIRLKPKDEKPQESGVVTVKPVPNPDTSSVVPPTEVIAPKPADEVSKDVKEEKTNEPDLKEEKTTEPDLIEQLENLLKQEHLFEPDAIELNPKVADIFSDEDSASDNEGRFKIKERNAAKPPILPFSKLVNGEKREIKAEPLLGSKRVDRRRDRRERTDSKPRSRLRRSADRKPVGKEGSKDSSDRKSSPKRSEPQDKPRSKSRISLKSDRHVAPIERRFERKIEIKIKNPSKYERGSGKLKFNKEDDKPREDLKRKVELSDKEVLEEDEEEEPEIIVENNSGDDENSLVNEGDLRAQLSKKRAEKLHRIPVEGVSSRLLQNALQGAVYKKTKTKSKEPDITSSDGKLPIHLRLGIASTTDIFAEAPTKAKRKSRKRKNREVLEQV